MYNGPSQVQKEEFISIQKVKVLIITGATAVDKIEEDFQKYESNIKKQCSIIQML